MVYVVVSVTLLYYDLTITAHSLKQEYRITAFYCGGACRANTKIKNDLHAATRYGFMAYQNIFTKLRRSVLSWELKFDKKWL